MTTRGSLARGQGQQQFQGNVQKWVRQWVEPGTGPGSSKVALLKWVPTGDRSGSKPGPRFPHLHPVSNANLKLPLGNKDKGKKPVPRQREAMSSQPAAMEIDGSPDVLASKLQKEGTQSAAVNPSRARESNGEVHTAPNHPVQKGATEQPHQEPPAATSQHDIEAAPEEVRSLHGVAAEPIQASCSHADTAFPANSAPAVDFASHHAAPASQSDPETQQPAAELQTQQTTVHGSTQELQNTTAAESGSNVDEELPLPASLGDEAPGQAPAGRHDEMLTGRQPPAQTPAGRDDEALTGLGPPDQAPAGRDGAVLPGQQAPDQAMTPEWDGMLAGEEAQSGGGDGVLTGLGSPSGGPDQASVGTAAETAASAAAADGAVQLQQPAGDAHFGPRSVDEQPQIHSEPAVAAPSPAKRPAEGLEEGKELDAKRAKVDPGTSTD